jgi:hypothetical protein
MVSLICVQLPGHFLENAVCEAVEVWNGMQWHGKEAFQLILKVLASRIPREAPVVEYHRLQHQQK